jgi:phage/plasmid-like protein (TIGR03299 family)
VVCHNTLTIALNGATSAIRVPHSTAFDAQAVKKQLGIAVSNWDSFMYRMKTLAERKVKTHEAMNYFLKVICQPTGMDSHLGHLDPAAKLVNERALKKVQALYDGQGRGAELASAQGTAWGLLNAVTEFVDHERRARSQEYRLDSAWFGQGANLKQRALDQALQLVA